MRLGSDVINFGKYKGTRLSDVPEDYVLWMIDNSKKTITLYQAELDRRKLVEEGSMSMVERIAAEGYRSLAKKMHPDAGGSAEDFRSLQAAKEQMSIILKEVAEIR